MGPAAHAERRQCRPCFAATEWSSVCGSRIVEAKNSRNRMPARWQTAATRIRACERAAIPVGVEMVGRVIRAAS